MMLKYLSIAIAGGFLAVAALSYQARERPFYPDFDHAHGAFVCQNTPLYSMCKTKAGILPIAWQRYGRND